MQLNAFAAKETVYFCSGGSSAHAPGVLRHLGTSMADPSVSGEPGNQKVVAHYVATVSSDLAAMARGSGLETLGYLLEMVRLEAENISRHAQNGGR
jgi:hypothetical protein